MRKWLPFVVALTACTTIGPGHVGIVVDKIGGSKGVQDVTMKTGFTFYNPATTSIYEYPTYVQSYVWTHDEKEGSDRNEEITVTTKDQMTVAMDVNVAYSLIADKVPAFYVKFRSDNISQFTHGFLRSVTRDCFNEHAGKYGVEQLMGDNAQFIKDARACTQQLVGQYGVNIEQLGIIGAPRPPAAVITAINAKVGATQLAMQKQNEIVQAEADAKKAMAEAEGQAQSTLTRAKAQAEANRILAQSLTAELIEYRKLDRWDGRLPLYTGGGQPLINLKP